MFRSAFAPFKASCKRQGVELHPKVLQAGNTGKSSMAWTVEPNGLYAAVAEAGNILRESPDTKLLDSAITPPRSVRHPLNRWVAARGLIYILNASLERQPGNSWDTTFHCHGTRAIATCPDADEGFARVIAQLKTPNDPIRGRSRLVGYQLITGENDQPIAVRKGMGQPSTLSLTELTINGIPYPAGAIFRAEIMDNLEKTESGYEYHTRLDDEAHVRVGVERVSHIAFRRLSAFAVDPPRREKEFPTYGKLMKYANWVEPIRAVTIDEARAMAYTAVQSAVELE